MVFRIVIDALRGGPRKKIEIEFVDAEECANYSHLGKRPTLLHVKTNRFLPADFVFRCKVIALQ
jgi:hypothetical protein